MFDSKALGPAEARTLVRRPLARQAESPRRAARVTGEKLKPPNSVPTIALSLEASPSYARRLAKGIRRYWKAISLGRVSVVLLPHLRLEPCDHADELPVISRFVDDRLDR